eukprot:2737954-Rhodomonas_salina.1
MLGHVLRRGRAGGRRFNLMRLLEDVRRQVCLSLPFFGRTAPIYGLHAAIYGGRAAIYSGDAATFGVYACHL